MKSSTIKVHDLNSDLRAADLDLEDLSSTEFSVIIGGESRDHPLYGVRGFMLWAFTLGMAGDVYQAYPLNA